MRHAMDDAMRVPMRGAMDGALLGALTDALRLALRRTMAVEPARGVPCKDAEPARSCCSVGVLSDLANDRDREAGARSEAGSLLREGREARGRGRGPDAEGCSAALSGSTQAGAQAQAQASTSLSSVLVSATPVRQRTRVQPWLASPLRARLTSFLRR